jgi:hypothetical protein
MTIGKPITVLNDQQLISLEDIYMGLDKMITATAIVVGKNILELHPGGTYNLNEDNEIERRVVNLHLVSMFADMAAAELCQNGECMQTLQGPRLEQLGEDIFEAYAPFIRQGINVFGLDSFYERKTLAKYAERIPVNGYLNAGPNERTEGLPEGWWYEFPGQAQKMFACGFLVIDIDECLRVGVYQNNTDEQPIDMVYISQRGNYSEVFKKFTGIATEVLEACEFIYNQYHI